LRAIVVLFAPPRLLKGQLAATAQGRKLDDSRQLSVPAECVRQLDLARRLAIRRKQARVCDDEDGATRARGSNIQPIEAVQELQSTRASSGEEVVIE
jgi:hypothetical protein